MFVFQLNSKVFTSIQCLSNQLAKTADPLPKKSNTASTFSCVLTTISAHQYILGDQKIYSVEIHSNMIFIEVECHLDIHNWLLVTVIPKNAEIRISSTICIYKFPPISSYFRADTLYPGAWLKQLPIYHCKDMKIVAN